MRQKELEKMPLDELWKLHERVEVLLSAKLEAGARELEERLATLRGRIIPTAAKQTRRHYPKVYPRFRNPVHPEQTWSGRGKQPIWIREALAAGRPMDDFRVSGTGNL